MDHDSEGRGAKEGATEKGLLCAAASATIVSSTFVGTRFHNPCRGHRYGVFPV